MTGFADNRKMFTVGLVSLFLIFSWNLFTTAKTFILIGLILLVLRGRALRHLDVIFFLLAVSLTVVYSLDNGQLPWYFVPLPCFCYLTGKWIGGLCHSERMVLFIYLLVAVLLSAVTWVSLATDFARFGFLSLARNVEVVGASEQLVSATVLGGNLVMLSALSALVFSVSSLRAPEKWIVFSLVALGVLCALRLGSRTHLAISLACALTGLFINRSSLGWRTIAFTGTAIWVGAFFIVGAAGDSVSALSYFSDRMYDEASSISSAGGRLDRWTQSIEFVFSHGYGWELERIGYAHNLWLDAARRAGTISFVALCVLTLAVIFKCYIRLRNKRMPVLLKSIFASMLVAFFLLFLVEPIFDGFFYPFIAFWTILGVCMSYRLPAAHASQSLS